ncbi:reverse transcriptase domain-containing protein, partial [Tanacetum coccineum]
GVVKLLVKLTTTKHHYHLPEIDLKIESVLGFPLKCFLDAYKDHQQVQMAEEDKEKTTFYIDQGTYSYTKMPFSLKKARATYQRLVGAAFQSQIVGCLEAYVDDMVVKSNTEKEMIADVAETFDNLRRINMKLNPKKCSLGVEEGKFIGYTVTSEGVRANPAKTKDIAEMKSPRPWGQMQILSGKLAALNRFLSRLAKKSLPFFETLKNITKENKDDYRWMEDAEIAFQELKKTALNLPSLTTPVPKETLAKLCSVREVSLGVAACVKKAEEIFQSSPHKCCQGPGPSGLHQRSLGRQQCSGSQVHSIHGRPTYKLQRRMGGLYGRGIMYQRLGGWLSRVRSITGRIMNSKEDEDVLSKLALVAFNHLNYEILVEILEAPSTNRQEINAVVEEEGDNWMTPIIKWLEEGKWPEDQNEARTSVVAKAIRQGYYWLTMHRDAREEICKCDSCQIHSSVPKLPKTLITSIMAPCSFYQWGMDVLGPLPKASRKVKFVIVAIDYFTKWIEAKPLAKTTRHEVKKFV